MTKLLLFFMLCADISGGYHEEQPKKQVVTELTYAEFIVRIKKGEEGVLYIGDAPKERKGLTCVVKSLAGKAKGVYHCFAVKGEAFMKQPKWKNNDGVSIIIHGRTVHGFVGDDVDILKQHDAWHDKNGGNPPRLFRRLQSPT